MTSPGWARTMRPVRNGKPLDSSRSGAVPDPPGPIIPVRYAMCRKSEGRERVLSLVQTISRTATEGALIRLIKATLPEVRLVAKMLREGTRRMSPAALARHATGGGATNGIDAGFWALSFIGVPAPNPEKYSMSDQEFVDAGMIPCSCGCDAPGVLSCSGCRGAVYKDKDCQRRHWKEHKLVCSRNGKGGDSSGTGAGRGAGGGEGRAVFSPRLASSAPPQGPSILIDLTIDDHYIPEGMVLSTIALNPGGVHNSQLRGSGGVAPLNRHGSARFIVKAQAPLEGYHMLIYDDSKGLHHFIIKWRAPQLLEAIGKEPTWGGLKAYFYAVREGDSLRVFTGEFAPTQGW